jgi:hypothetical protein
MRGRGCTMKQASWRDEHQLSSCNSFILLVAPSKGSYTCGVNERHCGLVASDLARSHWQPHSAKLTSFGFVPPPPPPPPTRPPPPLRPGRGRGGLSQSGSFPQCRR